MEPKKYKPVHTHAKAFQINKKSKKKKKRNKGRIALNLLLVCGLGYCIYTIAYHKITDYETDRINADLIESVQQADNQIDYNKLLPSTPSPAPTMPTVTSTPSVTSSPDSLKTMGPAETADPTVTKSPTKQTDKKTSILSKYKSAYDENNDMVGWIRIDNTTINYPVMYTKEPDYYERRNFNKKYSDFGSIWIDENNTVLGDDQDNNLLIYGHNIWTRNTMFNILHGYEDESYYLSHPSIHFDTLYEEGTYDIIACVLTEVLMDNEDGFRYYYFTGYDTEEEFNDYMSFLNNNKLYDTGIEAEYGDKLITLSTCSKHVDGNGGRFIVVARRRTN